MKPSILNRMKNLMIKMMISCEEASFLIDKEQYTLLGFKEKFDLKLHLLTCKFCRLYKIESHIINDKMTKVFKFNKVELKLSDDQKQKMIDKLNLEAEAKS